MIPNIDTRLWKMGNYPMPEPQPKTPADIVEELRGFHHYEAADLLEQLLAERAANEDEEGEQ